MVTTRAGGRMWRAIVATVAVVAMAGSACGGDDEPPPAATSPQVTTASPTETPTSPPETTSSPTETASGSGAVVLGQIDFGFVPPSVSVAQGESITVTNRSTDAPHTFTVEGTDIDVVNDAGISQDVVIDLSPGEYPFVCRFHGQMRGTLTVT